jgi:type II secretory pathway pseudopilin PulG
LNCHPTFIFIKALCPPEPSLTPSPSPTTSTSIMRAPSPSRQCSFYPTDPYILSNLSHYASVYNPSPSSLTDSQKRQKLQELGSGFIDYESSINYALPYNSVPQPSTRHIHLNPHINLQRASEPASPATLSTRSPPSPSRSSIMSAEQSPQDFQLYDDGAHISADRRQKQQVNRRYDSVHSFEHRASPAPNSRFGSVFPTAVPQSEPHTSRPGLPYYSNFRPDNDFSKPPAQQQHQYLQALPQFRNQGSNMVQMIQTQHHGSDDEDPPALSPHTQSHFSASSRPSLSDVDLHSPATPIASPGPNDGAEGCGAPVPAVSEDSSYLVEAWIEHYLRSESDVRTATPRLGRTFSDAIQDELFNPGIAPGTSITSQSMQDPNNMNSKLPTFLHQAQTQHSMARATPPTTRGHSPFRDNSPFHPAARTNQFTLPQSPSRTTSLLPVAFGTARAQREQEAERDAELLSQQIQQDFGRGGEGPKTISPKDAFVDYCEPEEEEVKGSLFPQDDAYSQDGSAHGGSYRSSAHGDDDVQSDHSFGIKTEESFGSMATSRRQSDVSMNLSPQLYASNSNQQYAQICFPYTTSVPEGEHDYDYNPASSPNSKPAESRANGGVYTCTVPGCTKRFPTTTKMSKHRREAHRQSTPLSSIKSHHPGPHKCTRINPTTNKPCNTIFSRPYDLTRHEDTIHNTDRQKVRCEICNDEKTFSRQDALTRHKKVKHGIDK